MKLKWIAALAASVVLAGCTDADWDHVMNYAGIGSGPPPREEAPPPAQQNTPWVQMATPEESTPPAAQPAPQPFVPVEQPAPQPQAAAAPHSSYAPAPQVQAAAAPSPAPQVMSGEANWCQRVARSAAEQAANEGFDTDTQRNRATAIYRQCMGS